MSTQSTWDTDSRQTTVEAVVQTRKPTGAETYFAKSNTTELVKMTSTATIERSVRIPDLKTTTCLKLHLKCNINWNSGVFLAGVEAPSPLLLALLPLPPAAGGHPGGSRARRSA